MVGQASRLFTKFNHLLPSKIVVVGDLILDVYTEGKISRVSPEAPVTVLHVDNKSRRLGGAANVALNLKALGMDPVCIGCVGDDSGADDFIEEMESQGISSKSIFRDNFRKTCVKNRLIASNQQIVRIDEERIEPISSSLEKQMLDALSKDLNDAGAVILSDYAKGTLTDTLIQSIIALAKKANVPVIVDPKGLDFSKYKGASVIKPNEKEAYEAAGLERSHFLEDVAKSLRSEIGNAALIITRAEKGMAIFEPAAPAQHSNAIVRKVKDVTGAGDTVCATLSCCIANGWDLKSAADLANVAASLSIEGVGCVAVTLSDLAKRLIHHHFTSKVFEQDNLFALKHVLSDREFNLLTIEEGVKFSAQLFHALINLKSQHGKKELQELVVYFSGEDPCSDLVSILNSLEEIDYIVMKKSNLESLCSEIKPSEIFAFRAGKVDKVSHMSEVLTV